ncbi:MAG: hypothetical protein BRD28_05475 [Bacteroidetes bacterium QH_10_64_37]|nr:MAG: hypothetical protein BRD28_05475 [Bacteroidetes bacterium QH_10_64_37]
MPLPPRSSENCSCIRRRWEAVRPALVVLGVGLLWGLAAGAPQNASAQDPLDSLRTAVTLFGVAGSGEALPFWLRANQYGTIDPTSANAGLLLSAHRPFSEKSGLDYAFGAEVLGRASHHATVTFHELYGRLRYWRLQLTAGRREQMIGRVDTSLSLGSVTWSKNASPPPKINLSSDGYVPVPGTGKGLALKGYLAHGWLEHDRVVRDALLHEKYLYVRILPPDVPITAHAGITHHAVWGGTSPPQVVSLRRWADVAFGLGVLSRSERDSVRPQREANHIATYDFSVDVDLGGAEALVYRQFYHEDIASFRFRNVWDGLWGVGLQWDDSALVSSVLWEHLRMTRHNAMFSAGQERGADSYYNHFRYRGGWTYQGRTLGIPLLTPASRTPGLSDDLPSIGNNIVVAHHFGVEGHLGAGLSYRALGTYSRNYGAKSVCGSPACTTRTNRRRDRRDQWSFRIGVSGSLSERYNLWFRTAAALDTGEFYDDRVGLSFDLTWRSPGGR